jgi:general secretion pathway protein N
MKLTAARLGLLALNAVLALGLAQLWTGDDGPVRWLPPGTAEPDARRAADPLPTLPVFAPTDLTVAWKRPLFSPGRQPDAGLPATAAPGLDGLSLNGVIIDGDTRWALLRQRDKRSLRLKPGDRLDGDWLLAELDATSVTFTRQGQVRRLSLPFARLPAPGGTPLPKHLDVKQP